MAAQSNPLINFPEGSLISEAPSSLTNCIPALSNIPSNYSMLNHVPLEKEIRGALFMLLPFQPPLIFTVPFPYDSLQILWSPSIRQLQAQTLKREGTSVEMLSEASRRKGDGEGNEVMGKVRLNSTSETKPECLRVRAVNTRWQSQTWLREQILEALLTRKPNCNAARWWVLTRLPVVMGCSPMDVQQVSKLYGWTHTMVYVSYSSI